LENSDPLQPRLVSLVNGQRDAPVKCGNDNPDNFYQSAVICSHYTYRLHGTRGTVPFLSIGAQAGQYGKVG
jgi:hypothetical protein